jgi:hypothetical protein
MIITKSFQSLYNTFLELCCGWNVVVEVETNTREVKKSWH